MNGFRHVIHGPRLSRPWAHGHMGTCCVIIPYISSDNSHLSHWDQAHFCTVQDIPNSHRAEMRGHVEPVRWILKSVDNDQMKY